MPDKEEVQPPVSAEDFNRLLANCDLGTVIQFTARETFFQSSPGVTQKVYFLGINADIGAMLCVKSESFDAFSAGQTHEVPRVTSVVPVTAYTTVTDIKAVDDALSEKHAQLRLFAAGAGITLAVE